ncbi:hypothetical protein [Prevotella communis]|nr:hypothetical protein [Prevotella communis]
MLGWLVMAAALSFTACSSENDLTQEPTPQQQAQTIHISVGAGIDPATTRSTVDYSNGVRTLQFTTGDRLYVWGSYGEMEEEPSGQEYYPYIIAGYLDLDSDSFDPSNPTNATFSGDLTVYEWTYEVGDYEDEWNEEIEDWEKTGQYFVTTPGYYSPVLSSPGFLTNDPLADFEDVTATLLHKDAVEDDDYGILDRDLQIYYRHNCATTVEELMTKQLTVSGVYDPSTKSFALTKNANQPILNCTISGLEDGVSYKVDYIYGATAAMSDHSTILYSSLTATSGTLSFAFFAKPANYFHGIRLTNTADANDTYDVNIGQKAFDSKVYNLSRYWYGGAMHRLVDLGNVNTSTHPDGLTLQDGDAVTGLLDGNSKNSQRLQISIADGASVILKGVDIQGYKGENYKWAGLTCAGDATIILADGSTNTVNGFYRDYPGIFIAEGKTLTIQGSGSLTATSGGSANPFGAGIGGARNIACGNIVIEGGTVTAKGGTQCAGIGSGGKACGDISISGTANVTATGGSGAGIGSGKNGSCGTITISGTAHVTATGGGSGAGIGSGGTASCGNITISGTAHVTAKGGGSGAGIGSGVGISSGSKASCGNITISGSANVEATGGGDSGAGIGSGKYGTVSGTISIEGGTVEATAGSAYSAGIGSGEDGSCGAIVIGSGITQVIAKKIAITSDIDIIGAGYNGTYGTVTIDGVADATTSSTFPHLTSVLTNSDKIWTLTQKNPNP